MLKVNQEKEISKYIIGVDEVGRGPLAGPVVSAAVRLSKNFNITELNDSKKLSKSKREEVYNLIINKCEYQLGISNVEEIDKLNILQATFLSMRRAINKFKLPSNYKILVDGPWSFDKANKNILPKIKGDSIYPSIAAASIIAKVYRDNLMLNLSKEYSNYLWERNSGYGTKKHIQAIKLHGITKHHRKSFAPIHKILSH
ncbi:MAG: ribonuclease HII [Pelagibacteraceae bacterium]|jgi:ribonuclease HII|tara:strand:- start:1095 stop:1694 length:600 start_codon:yes stop_codon:yes gene_type:complete